jgi:hypothetical protein
MWETYCLTERQLLSEEGQQYAEVNFLKPNVSYLYGHVQHSKPLHSAHTVYFCVLRLAQET